MAWNSGAVPVILLTKADLTEDHDAYLQAAARVAPGVDVHAVSARTGYGLDALDRYLQPGNTVVFLGCLWASTEWQDGPVPQQLENKR